MAETRWWIEKTTTETYIVYAEDIEEAFEKIEEDPQKYRSDKEYTEDWGEDE